MNTQPNFQKMENGDNVHEVYDSVLSPYPVFEAVMEKYFGPVLVCTAKSYSYHEATNDKTLAWNYCLPAKPGRVDDDLLLQVWFDLVTNTICWHDSSVRYQMEENDYLALDLALEELKGIFHTRNRYAASVQLSAHELLALCIE